MVELERIPVGVAHGVGRRLAAVLGAGRLLTRSTTTHVILLLVDAAGHSLLLSSTLASSDARADSLIEIHDTSRTLQRIAAKTVRLVARLMQRTTTRLGTAKVCILGIHILVTTSIHRAKAFGSCERASAFVVGDSYPRECLWMLLCRWMLLACFDLSQLYATSVGLVSSSSSSGTNAL